MRNFEPKGNAARINAFAEKRIRDAVRVREPGILTDVALQTTAVLFRHDQRTAVAISSKFQTRKYVLFRQVWEIRQNLVVRHT